MKPNYGQRILTSLIDTIAREQPEKPYAAFPKTSSFAEPLVEVNFADLSRAINRASWWLEEVLGGRASGSKTIAWIGPNDIRYIILTIAANKAGYTLLLPSPRNSVAFHAHIFKTTNCNVVLKDESFDMSAVKAELDFKEIIVPQIDWFLDPTSVGHYPYQQTPSSFEEKVLIIHSSGSTGLPKCITFTHGTFAAMDSIQNLSFNTTSKAQLHAIGPGAMLSTFPLFHLSGLIPGFSTSIFYDHKLILPGPGQVKADTLIDAVKHLDLDIVLAAPSVLEDLTLDPRAPETLSKIKDVIFGGGPIVEERGAIIAKYCRLISMIGTTESGLFPTTAHDPEEFNWLSFPQELKGVEFREAGDGLYEMFYVRDIETDQYHATWISFPDLNEYSTKDLYIKHSTKPGLWKHSGRTDDVLVLSNGEKVVVPPLQDVLSGSPDVHEALIFGHGHFDIGALIELGPQAAKLEPEEAINRLAPYISQGNKFMPKYAKLAQDRLLFTKADKPMVRAPKGTVIRPQTLALYGDEIEKLYKGSDDAEAQNYPILSSDAIAATQSLIKIYQKIMDSQAINEDTNVFIQGFDSLGVMNAIRKIKSIIQVESNSEDLASRVTTALIYANPTIRQLAETLRGLGSSNNVNGASSHIDAVEAMLKKYAAGLPEDKVDASAPVTCNLHVVLTGSTGSLGAYILDTFIQSDKIAHIYALNRAIDGAARQVKTNDSRGLPTNFKKVTFLHTDLSKRDLGLSQEHYNQLKTSVHLVIHNQWQVDFNLPLSSFEPHISGVRNLIDLSIESALHPYIVFTSSISTVTCYPMVYPEGGEVPEAVFEDARVPFPMGYGESKHISERLLNIASQKTGIPTSTARIGQVAGPVTRLGGIWNAQEWAPSIFISSAYMRLVPSELGTIDWIPVDTLADALVDVSLYDITHGHSKKLEGSIVYSMANPKTIQWEELIPTVLEHMPAGTKTVEMREWVDALKKSAADPQVDTVRNPGVKLLDFYEGLCLGPKVEVRGNMEIKNGLRSNTLQQLEAVQHEWLSSWLNKWGLPAGNIS